MPADRDSGVVAGRRRRDFGTAVVVVAVVAVVAVLVAGRLGAGGKEAATTTIFPASSSPGTAGTTPAPSTTTPATTTTVPEVAVTTVRIEQLGGQMLAHPAGIDLFVWSNPDQLMRIELDRGRLTRTNVPAVGTSGQVFFLAGPHRVIVRPADNVPGYQVPDGDEPRPLGNYLAQPVYAAYPGPDEAHYWIVTGDQFNQLLLVDTEGLAAAAPVEIPGGFVTGSDGTGQILVRATGGTYASGPSGFTRVSSGEVIAAGATRLVTLECDEHLVCDIVVVDRASGRRTTLGPPGAASHAFTPGVVSPDGGHAAYAAVDRAEQALYLLDLRTGHESKISDILAYTQTPGAWSADGRYFFYVDDKYGLRVRDVFDGGDTELVKGLPPVNHLVSRLLAGR